MVDCYALLDEPRRPWIDPEALKQKFLSLSAVVHPDRVHQAGAAEKQAAQRRYAELNAAYNRLREPRGRLRHLLELELGALPADIQQIPPQLVDLFMEVGQLNRDADAVLKEKSSISSPLLKVQLFERNQVWTEKLIALQNKLNDCTSRLLTELKAIDSEWAAKPDDADVRGQLLQRLEDLYRLLGYFGRWTSQIQERIVRLAF
jgi:curved DNA-binding protein CbpA